MAKKIEQLDSELTEQFERITRRRAALGILQDLRAGIDPRKLAGYTKRAVIDDAIAMGLVAENSDRLVIVGKPAVISTSEAWLTDDLCEEIPEPAWPVLAGLKLKNGDRAELDQFLIYCGSAIDCQEAARELAEIGVESTAKKNGDTGCWRLRINLASAGELFQQAA